MQLSSIRSNESEGEDSPATRRKKALDQFAASMSASQDSKPQQSPSHYRRERMVSRLSINMQQEKATSGGRALDLPYIETKHGSPQNLIKSSDMHNSPGARNKQRISQMGIGDQTRPSRNQNLFEINSKTDGAEAKVRKKASTQFTGLVAQHCASSGVVYETQSEQQEIVQTQKSPRNTLKVPKAVKKTDPPSEMILHLSKPSENDSVSDSEDPTMDQRQNVSRGSTQENIIETQYRSRLDVSNINEPLPLLAAGLYRPERETMWNKRRINQKTAAKTLSKADQEILAEREEFEKMQRLNRIKRQKDDQKLQEVQERLFKSAANIKISTNINIPLEDYAHHFKYKIYECFKPEDLKQTRNYIEYLTSNEQDSKGGAVYEDDMSPELYSYLEKKLNTRLPSWVNEDKLLQFDSNFESGNLDSVYVIKDSEYNMLCKVDTNTRGNTYWFYFKVLNWVPKSQATFNLLNVARDLAPFYTKGMNIWTRTESADARYKSDWQCSKNNVEVVSFQQNDILRSKSTKKEYAMGRYYNTLKFKCKFPEIKMLKGNGTPWPSQDDNMSASGYTEVGPNDQGEPGTVFCFAYALPYTYSDLTSDLENSRKFLLSHGGTIINQQAVVKRDKEIVRKEQMVFSTAVGSHLVKPESKKTAKLVVQKKESDRQVLTKQQLASQEMKKIAIKTANENRSKFEIQLLKADEDKETESPLIKQSQNSNGCRLLEIHTDFLYYKQEIVSQSMGGLNIYQITLTKRKQEPKATPYHKKKCMYITARMHAAETHGSLIMKNMIHELVTRSDCYDTVLSNYVIKLVPLINTDGVTIGNSRSSLVGLDLNRRWADPNASIHPEIFFLKKIMQQQADLPQGISIYCDLHGHNRKSNCFFYGCNKAADEGMLSWTKTRLLPKIFASIEQIFEFESCRFKQDKYKLNTARVVIWNEMKVTNSFTLETSMYDKTVSKALKDDPSAITSSIQSVEGTKRKNLKHVQLTMHDMHQIAKSFLVATAQYSKLEKELEKEWKFSEGWFKPSKLNAVTGEAARDKQKRLQLQKQSTKNTSQLIGSGFGGGGGTARKPVQRLNSTSSFKEPLTRKKIGKHNSNMKVTSTDAKQTARETSNNIVPMQQKRAKRMQSLINVNSSGVDKEVATENKNSAKKRGPKSSNTQLLLGEDIPPTFENKAKTSKKPKGPKVQAILQDDSFFFSDQQKQSQVFAKLSSWKEFFDLEEFQTGAAEMQKSPTKTNLTQLTEEDGGSDSEPSCDNFDQLELEENLAAALEADEEMTQEENNPFKRPFEDVEEEKSQQTSMTEDQVSIASLENEKMPTEFEDEASSQNPPDSSTNEATNSGEFVQTREDVGMNIVSIDSRSRPQVGGRYMRNPSINRSIQPNSVAEPRRTNQYINYPEIANRLINQLILQDNARQMQSSAAPPSGSANQPVPQITSPSADLTQNHVLRGYSVTNQATPNSTVIQPIQNNEGNASTIFFTDQQRRMAVRNIPSTQFAVLGQGVSSLNATSAIESNGQSSVQQRQARKARSKIKGLTPLPANQVNSTFEDGNFVAQPNAQSKARNRMNEHRQSRQLGSIQARGPNFNSESRGTNRGAMQRYIAQTSSAPGSQGNNSANRSQRRGKQKQQADIAVAKLDNSQEVLSSFNDRMNETSISNSSKKPQAEKMKTVRNSRQKFYTNGKDGKQVGKLEHQKNVKEAGQTFDNQHKYGFDQTQTRGTKNISSTNSSLVIHSSNCNTLPHHQPQYMKRQFEESKSALESTLPFASKTPGNINSAAISQDQYISQFAYSPMQNVTGKKELSEHGGQQQSYLTPYGAKKQSFSTPRYQRLVARGAPNFKTGGTDTLNLPGMEQSLLTVAGAMSHFGNTSGYQTGYSGGSNIAGANSQTGRTTRQDRKFKEVSVPSSSMSKGNGQSQRNNIMNHVHGFEIQRERHSRLQSNNAVIGEQYSLDNRNQMTMMDQEVMPVIEPVARGGRGAQQLQKPSPLVHLDEMPVGSSASQRVTPAIGIGGFVKEIKIRKGRNFRQGIPNQTPSDPSSMTVQGYRE